MQARVKELIVLTGDHGEEDQVLDDARYALEAVRNCVFQHNTVPPEVRPQNRLNQTDQKIDDVATVSTLLLGKLREPCLDRSLYCPFFAGVIDCREREKEKRSYSLMTSKASEKVQPLPRNLKREFENAVRDIYQAELTGKTPMYRKPIFQRSGARAPESGADAQKRALADAAKALAQLWKVSPSR